MATQESLLVDMHCAQSDCFAEQAFCQHSKHSAEGSPPGTGDGLGVGAGGVGDGVGAGGDGVGAGGGVGGDGEGGEGLAPPTTWHKVIEFALQIVP